jgi:predicted DNA-binding ribbon-helix-helix protein
MGRDIVTSFRIDGDLWKEAKIHAIKKEMTMKELIEYLLKRELENEKEVDKEENEDGIESKE